MRPVFNALCAIALLAAGSGPALAQADSYPNKPVRILVGFPPGSATDVAARRIAQKLSAEMGQPFIVDNRPGASGSLAAEAGARAAPDGYTLYAGTTSEIAINRPGGMKIRYDPVKDFMPVALLFTTNPLLMASMGSNFKSLREVVEASKAKPESVSFAAVNAFQQVVVSSFEKAAGIKLNVIYYKGTGPAMSDLLGSQIDGMVAYPAESMKQVEAGKARALAIVGEKRNAFMPGTPTILEAGYKVPELMVWGGIFAPTGTPSAIVERLNKEIVAANKLPDIRDAVGKTGSDVRLYATQEFKDFVGREISKWDHVVKESGIRLD